VVFVISNKEPSGRAIFLVYEIHIIFVILLVIHTNHIALIFIKYIN
jgi:hypothetical protein